MNIWHSLVGMLEVELVSADLWSDLEWLAASGITIHTIEVLDELTARFHILQKDASALADMSKRVGSRFRIIRSEGVFWTVKALFRRPVLLGGLLLVLALTAFLPTRVLFVRVEGNERLEEQQIVEAAEKSGICFGASRRDVRSEKIKNALLSALPELQWAGVNTKGCQAVISVRERAKLQEESADSSEIRSIVAGQDGIILSCTAEKGNLVCQPGQAVKKGEMLISAYTDCGFCIRAVRAEGEVFAQTSRSLRAITPTEYLLRRDETPGKKRYSLLIGKKRINLWKNSGIWDSTCGRIDKENYLTLPGGFRLPIALCWEASIPAAASSAEVSSEEALELLKRFGRNYLLNHMTAGTIQNQQESITQENGLCILSAQYSCTEMIGRVHMEQIGESNGQTG